MGETQQKDGLVVKGAGLSILLGWVIGAAMKLG